MSEAVALHPDNVPQALTDEEAFGALFGLFAKANDSETAIAVGDKVRVAADPSRGRMCSAIVTVGSAETVLSAQECRRLAVVLAGAALAMGG